MFSGAKAFIVVIFLVTGTFFSAKAQVKDFTNDLIGVPLQFFEHKDSIPNLMKIVDSLARIDSNYFNIRDTFLDINLITELYSHYMDCYLVKSSLIDSGLYVVLSFAFNRLYAIDIYAKDNRNLIKFYKEIFNYFEDKTSGEYARIIKDYTTKSGYKFSFATTIYGKKFAWSRGRIKKIRYSYSINFEKVHGYISLNHKGVERRIPPWCMTRTVPILWHLGWPKRLLFRKRQNWKRLNKYINRNVKQLN
ncbi:hypothetical protein GC194_14080 [bacterium]|nr:hypothetical protein [bacterium]